MSLIYSSLFKKLTRWLDFFDPKFFKVLMSSVVTKSLFWVMQSRYPSPEAFVFAMVFLRAINFMRFWHLFSEIGTLSGKSFFDLTSFSLWIV